MCLQALSLGLGGDEGIEKIEEVHRFIERFEHTKHTPPMVATRRFIAGSLARLLTELRHFNFDAAKGARKSAHSLCLVLISIF